MTKFAGFVAPRNNWSKLPHSLIEALPLIEGEAELKVILYVIRHTWGYQEQSKRISIDEFARGRKRQGQGRIDQGTGLSEKSIRRGIALAIDHGFLIVDEDDSDRARIRRSYRLRMSESAEQDLNPHNVDSAPLASDSACLTVQIAPRSKKETSLKEDRVEEEQKERTSLSQDAVPPVLTLNAGISFRSFLNGIGIQRDKAIRELEDLAQGHGYTMNDWQELWALAQNKAKDNPQGLFIIMVRKGQRA